MAANGPNTSTSTPSSSTDVSLPRRMIRGVFGSPSVRVTLGTLGYTGLSLLTSNNSIPMTAVDVAGTGAVAATIVTTADYTLRGLARGLSKIAEKVKAYKRARNGDEPVVFGPENNPKLSSSSLVDDAEPVQFAMPEMFESHMEASLAGEQVVAPIVPAFNSTTASTSEDEPSAKKQHTLKMEDVHATLEPTDLNTSPSI